MSDTHGGYTRIPDGLWYCDLSHGAARILGWLHSQELTEFNPTYVRETFGPTSVSWLAELTMAGYLDPRGTSGERLRYWLVPKAWDALA